MGFAYAKVYQKSSDIIVKYIDNKYYVEYSILISIPPKQVVSLLLDYKRLKEITPSISDIVLLEKGEEHEIVEVKLNSCILFFCKKIKNTQIVTVNKNLIQAFTIADKSDFRFASMTWDIKAEDNLTHLSYHAEIEPKFWVPPIIGPMLIKRKLKKEADIASSKLFVY